MKNKKMSELFAISAMMLIGTGSMVQAQEYGGRNGVGCPPSSKSMIEIGAILESPEIRKKAGNSGISMSSKIDGIRLLKDGDPALYEVKYSRSDDSEAYAYEVEVSGASSCYTDDAKVTSVKKIK